MRPAAAAGVYEMGYMGELTKYAESNVEMLKNAGVKTIVTPCSDCYAGFKVQYPKIGKIDWTLKCCISPNISTG